MIARLTPALLALALLAAPATAEDKDYLIELIAFGHTAWGDGAPWQPGVLLPDTGDAASLDDDLLPDGFERLGTGPALADTAVSLADSSRYPLLDYRVWRQPGLPRDAGQAVRINAGTVLNVVETPDQPARALATLGEVDDYTTMRIGRSTANALITRDETQVGQLNGTVTVTLGRYLHVESALVFSETTGERSVFYRDHRRMRSRRTHYIDNPVFGLIVHITPIEAVQDEDTVEPVLPLTGDS
ncbi:MAG: CsiV family protein [Pseudomonadota bacterium]